MDTISDLLDFGVFVCDPEGQLVAPGNAYAQRAFGQSLREGSPLAVALFDTERERENFTGILGQLADGILPPDVVLHMLPKRVTRGAEQWDVEYSVASTDEAGNASRVLVKVSMRKQEDEGDRASPFAYVKALLADIDVSKGFLRETQALIQALLGEGNASKLARTLHTVKGNCGCFAMLDLAEHVHGLEDLLHEHGPGAVHERLPDLTEAWNAKVSLFSSLLADDDSTILITRSEFDDLNGDLMGNRDWSEILGVVQTWSMELVDVRFRRLEIQIERFAAQAGKEVRVEKKGLGLRLPKRGLEGFWGSLVHVLRNMVDHGFDTAEARIAAGKSAVPTVRFSLAYTDNDAVLRLSDDGKGIDWERVRAKAIAKGIPHASHADLEAALFEQGFSTLDAAGLTAGRGVGLNVVWDEVKALFGRVEVVSTPGQGTEFVVSIPLSTLANLQLTA